ncbi:hypothetical protein [Luteimonas saliphila]|uniref:hypothetical protein n=1 Tax=Luteimonas saliphila TaxID=2804919 RepID=UPI00192E290B|nr:hypothetical protein [Luteimonas saliphila]
MAVAMFLPDALLFLSLLGFLGLVLYAAFGRLEVDRMQGSSRAAAFRALNKGDSP